MTISEIARAAGVSAKAIRLWEAKGLIPKAPRTGTGYRTFSESDPARLQFVRQAKAVGLTLDEISDIIDLRDAGTSPCGRVVEAIEAHLCNIEQTIAELVHLRQTLLNARAASGTPSPNNERIGFCNIIETVHSDG